MELVRGFHNLRPKHLQCVATIGNFDGLHKGHQKIFLHLKEKAKALNLPSTVITFEPHPQEFFARGEIPSRLTRLREKLILFEELGIDRALCLRFDTKLVHMLPEDFVKQVLIEGLGIKYLLVGDDFRFGYQRQGDFNLLKKLGQEFDFEVENTPTVFFENERISSTRIRKSLLVGDLKSAEKLLGRHYSMYGRVVHGSKQGRILGFPTANIYLHRHTSPVLGIFAVKVYGLNEAGYYGVADVGNRPTMGGSHTILEVHIFDFDEDVYGCYVQVEFLHKFRDEEKYDSMEILKQQIMIDAKNAREYFGI